MSGEEAKRKVEEGTAEPEVRLSDAAPGEMTDSGGDSWGAWASRVRRWASAHRPELAVFAIVFIALTFFSSQRFLRQSAAPHFVYQARAWLEGRTDIDPEVLPNYEDWACVRVVNGEKVRCTGRVQPTDKWYVSFPPFPAVVMLPFVAANGYQLNDTSFTVIIGALAAALFVWLLRRLSATRELERTEGENVALALYLAFGTVFFYCAIRGEVWFTAQVMGVALTMLYLRHAVGARRPVLAGLFFAMATLTRTPLMFAGLFFVLEVLCPGPTNKERVDQIKALPSRAAEVGRKLGLFAAGAFPLAAAAAWYNHHRFGSLSEFGHRFFYNNRVNVDIDRFGLFNLHYLQRNIEAAFLKLPRIQWEPFQISYDPHGLSLLLTLPVLVFLLWPKGERRLTLPLWLTVAVTALPGLFYQNTGYMQFGFRFSLDYTPYLLLLFAATGWKLKSRWVIPVMALGFLVNFWGAIAFRGYTEYVRNG